MSVMVNTALWLYYPSNYRLSPKFAAGYLMYDLLQLTALLYMTGGLANPFIVMILAPVTVSATVLTARATLLLVGMSCAVISLLAYFHMPLPWKGEPPNFPEIYLLGMWAALMLGLAFISAYVWRISHEGRRMTAGVRPYNKCLRVSTDYPLGWAMQLLLHINLAHRSVQLV